MDVPNFRSYTLIRYKLANTVSQIHTDLTIAFPETCPSLWTIARWVSEIYEGSFCLEKRTSPGRPRETRTAEDNIARVKELIERNPRMSNRKLAADISVPHSSVFRILTDDLRRRTRSRE